MLAQPAVVDPTAEFRTTLEAAGLRPTEIIADGQLHRCGTDAKPTSKNGWWRLYADPPAGSYGDWQTGFIETWIMNGEPLSPEDRARLRAEIAEQERRRKADLKPQRTEAMAKVRAYLEGLAPADTENPYLAHKGVTTCSGLLADGENLVVPVVGPDGLPMSYQKIFANGEKRFARDAPVAGGSFTVSGSDDGPLLIAEGLATSLSLHEATDYTVTVALNAGNLKAVARMARNKYPDRPIIICADDDHQTKGNPGKTKAEAAARAVGGKLAVPVFSSAEVGTDFNDLHQAEDLDAVRIQVEAAKEPSLKPSNSASVETGPPPGWPFKIDDRGVFKKVESQDKETGGQKVSWVRVCSRVDVIAETRDAEGRSWGRLLAVKTRENQINEWAMPMEMLAGDGAVYRAELLNLGLEISPGRFAREALHEYISTAGPQHRLRCVDRLGWHDAMFVLPDRVFGDALEDRVIFQIGAVHEHSYRQAGSLEDWKQEVAKYGKGNSRLAFSISAALAAPLLRLIGAEGGGFHFRGSSSIGKTTILEGAGSVWGGGGINGYCRNWRATSNGLETVGQAHCDTLLCLDEMGQVDGREAGATAYMLANGQGKSRAKRDGSGRPPAQWRVLFLSTGELSLAEKMNEAGRRARAGQEVRLVDIPADAGAGLGIFENLHGFDNAAALADHLRLAAGRNYGTAARAYLDKITSRLGVLAEAVRSAQEELISEYCPEGADGQVKRVAARFGLVAAAGTLATALRILPWPDEEAKGAAAKCFLAWLDQRGGAGAAELREGVAQVRAFFQAHGSSRFEPWSGVDGNRPVLNRAGFKRGDGQGETEYFVFPAVFRKEICVGFDAGLLAKEMVRLGLLMPGSDGKPQSTHRPPATGKPTRLYRFSSDIFSQEANHD